MTIFPRIFVLLLRWQLRQLITDLSTHPLLWSIINYSKQVEVTIEDSSIGRCPDEAPSLRSEMKTRLWIKMPIPSVSWSSYKRLAIFVVIVLCCASLVASIWLESLTIGQRRGWVGRSTIDWRSCRWRKRTKTLGGK